MVKHGKPYLKEPKPGYLYVFVRGKYLGRITAELGTEEFDRQYWEILRGKRAEAKTSWRALIHRYRRSDRWAQLKPRTRKEYDDVNTYLEDRIGDQDVSRLRRKDVIAAMEANRHRVRFANYIAQVMSVLSEHAIDIGWRSDNPAKGIRKLHTPPEKRREHVPWPDWAVDLWRAEARPVPRLIFEIAVGSVQRPRCSVPWCGGKLPSTTGKDAIWARYFTGAPRPRTPSELQYSDRRLRSRSSSSDTA